MNKKAGVLCILLAISLPPSVGMSQQPIHWKPTLESAQHLAGQTNRLVLIQFWAPWCVVCRRMEMEMLSQPAVVSVLNEKYVPVKINADNFPATARRYGITALPTTIITTPDGQLVDTLRGRLDMALYVERVSRVAADAERRKAAINAQASAGGAVTARRPVNVAAPSEAPRTDSVQSNQVASSSPAAESTPNLPGRSNAQPSRYAPPASYAPPQSHSPPPSAPTSATTPPRTYPPANRTPANVQPPRYANPPSTIGQSPSQATAGPVYGSQTPPPAVATQPTVNSPSKKGATAGLPSSAGRNTWENTAGQASSGARTRENRLSQPTISPTPAPAVNSPLCLDGFCPVSLYEKQQWLPGDRRWGAIHRGRTYLFTGPEEQRRFFTDPDRFAPVGSGNDVVLAAEQGRAVPGMRKHGVFFGNRIYLFSSEESLAKFAEKPEAYANQVLNAARSGAYNGRQRQ